MLFAEAASVSLARKIIKQVPERQRPTSAQRCRAYGARALARTAVRRSRTCAPTRRHTNAVGARAIAALGWRQEEEEATTTTHLAGARALILTGANEGRIRWWVKGQLASLRRPPKNCGTCPSLWLRRCARLWLAHATANGSHACARACADGRGRARARACACTQCQNPCKR